MMQAMVLSLSEFGHPLTSHQDMCKWVASGALQELHGFLRQTAAALQRQLSTDDDIVFAVGAVHTLAVEACACV